jgi:hypothetical protein
MFNGPLKKCSICNLGKDASCYYKCRASKDGLGSYCKDCDLSERKRRHRYSESRESVTVPKVKVCPVCHIEKSGFDFYKTKRNRDGLKSCCKKCSSKVEKKCRDRNRDRENIFIPDTKKCPRCKLEILSKLFYRKPQNKDGLDSCCKKCAIIRQKEASYGVSEKWIEDTLDSQGGACAICKFVPSAKGRPLGVDHNHSTNKVRGLLCDRCNMGIGHLKDSIETLKSAISYLEKYNGPL